MPSYLQNYGFTKTTFHDNDNNILNNEIQWNGNYNGKIANIDLEMNDNGYKESISMSLNNSDLRKILGIQPIEVPLETRLTNDFLRSNPITLEGALFKRKSRRHIRKSTSHKKRKSKRLN